MKSGNFTKILMAAALALPFFAKAEDKKYKDGLYAEMNTNKGLIVLNLEFEKTPMTVANFVGLAEGTKKTNKPDGTKFYDGLKFHRVIPNFMIQGGCPLGTGTGNPGYSFADEIHPDLKHTGPGILSMANSGPATNGSQFFITHVKTQWLDGKHTVFGNVLKGQDVVDSIAKGDKIKTVKIVRVGEKAKAFKGDEAHFKALEAGAADRARKAAEKRDAKQIKVIKEKFPNAKKEPNGLMYVIEKEGKGETPKAGQSCTLHYELTLTDGRKIDSSFDRGEPFIFPVGQRRVIKAWDYTVQRMKKGEKRTLIVPPSMGYGNRQMGPMPPNSYLIFKMELIDFK